VSDEHGKLSVLVGVLGLIGLRVLLRPQMA
jgi:hypothetical protein